MQANQKDFLRAVKEGDGDTVKQILLENGASIHEADDVSVCACTVYIAHL